MDTPSNTGQPSGPLPTCKHSQPSRTDAMPKPRCTLISLAATPYYHIVCRCVRRAFLCGEDSVTGRSFEHRRTWIQDRLFALAEIFAVDVCAYSATSNHYHLVLHIDRETAESWTAREVIERWHELFAGNSLNQRYINGADLIAAELTTVDTLVDLWHKRLMDISWFMRRMNESIARDANVEDNCTGRFWEGRFKSQALLDEAALMACMAYIDLNPVRASMAKTPEDSGFTSIQERSKKAKTAHTPNEKNQQPKRLMPPADHSR